MEEEKEPPFDPERWLAAVAPALGFDIDPEHAPGVIENLALAQAMAAIIYDTDIDADTLALAPAFRPEA